MVTRNVKRTYDFLEGLHERESCRINIPLPCSDSVVYAQDTQNITMPYLRVSWLGNRTSKSSGQIPI